MKRNKTDNKQDTMTETKTREQQSAESQAACEDNIWQSSRQRPLTIWQNPLSRSSWPHGTTKYLRLQAEFDNFRKRTLREKMELVEHGGEDVLKSVLSVLDDMKRAVEASRKSDDTGSRCARERCS